MGEGSRTHAEIIVAGGRRRALAERLGVAYGALGQWKRRDRIPEAHWERIIKAGLASDIELAWAVECRKRPGRKSRSRGSLPPPDPVWAEQRKARGGAGEPGRDLVAARDDLIAFCAVIDIPGLERGADGRQAGPAAHHRLWLEKLAAVERGEIRRLMGFMPPGAAKSTYAVDVFTPWFLARASQRSVLVATYATSLARRRGRKARSVARQAAFAAVFGKGLATGQKADLNWSLDNGSDWMGAGILAGITGHRADLIVIDDPVKGRAEADSALVRRRTREEFDDTIRTRLKAGGRIILIQTRWHEDDLAGSLLPAGYDGRSGPVACRDGQVWEVVNIPAMAERPDDPLGRPAGGWLWPEYWPASHWEPFRLNPRTWNALYQQRPRPEEGSYFERARFRRFQDADLPAGLRYYGSSDYAVSEGRGDYTRLVVWGLDEARNLYRVAAWGGRTGADEWIARQCDLIEQFRPLGGIRRWFGEAGVIQRAVEPMLRAKLRERRLSCGLQWLASAQDKTSRARAAQSLVREGRVFVRDDADGDCFIDECTAFPAGRHDDEVDTLSLMGRVLDQLGGPGNGRVEEYAETGPVFG
ncbi:MAG: hypothetical protein ACK4RV_17830 [Caulobacter sp.]